MPKFIDVHKMNPLTEQQIKQTQNAAKDEFGVTTRTSYTVKRRTKSSAF